MRFSGKCLDAGVAASAGAVLGAAALIAGAAGATIMFPGQILPALIGLVCAVFGVGTGAAAVIILGGISWLAVGRRVAARCLERQIISREGAHAPGPLGGRLVHALAGALALGGMAGCVTAAVLADRNGESAAEMALLAGYILGGGIGAAAALEYLAGEVSWHKPEPEE